MREVTGDLWYYLRDHAVVVPTNIGWTSDGRNPMGRGVALEAARRFPELPRWYGGCCRKFGAETPVVSWREHSRAPALILFPTKPLDPLAPAFSWRGSSTIDLIARSARQLAAWSPENVALPFVGCGEGGFGEADILPILREHLLGDNFLLVRRR